jgi:mannosyltransferase OCH1-like enzyme
MRIPKRIFTIWLGDKPPEWIEKCMNTHALPGYEHRIITLENCRVESRYLQECLDARAWVKAADYMRAWYLCQEGGIYLDADVEVVKPFDDLLDQSMFVGQEENSFVSNAIIGAKPGHPILIDFLGKVDRNFIGGGDLVFQPGMFLWTEIVRYSPDVRIYPPDFFLPYNHHRDELKVTDNTYTIHHFSKSWIRKEAA